MLVEGHALAAIPRAGATYRGALTGSQSSISISFRVSANSGSVTGAALSRLPFYCTGSGPPGARIVFAAAQISPRGTFTAAGRDLIPSGPLKGSVVATLTLTGTFGGGGRESGTLRTAYGGPAKRCGGHSVYATKA